MEEITRGAFLRSAGRTTLAVASGSALAGAFSRRGYAAPAAWAANPGIQKVGVPFGLVGYPTTTASVPILVAIKNGFFDRNGIKPILQNLALPGDMARALTAGQLWFAHAGNLPMLGAYAAGGFTDVRAIGTTQKAQIFTFAVSTASSIRTPADLRGKKLGVAGTPASGAAYLTTQLMSAYGLTSNDVNIVYIADVTAIPAAVENGVVDCGTIYKPVVNQGVIDGKLRIIWDAGAQTALKNLAEDGLFTAVNVIETQPQVVQNFMLAIAQAQQWARANTQKAATLWAKEVHVYQPVLYSALRGPVVSSFTPNLTAQQFAALLAAGHTLGSVTSDVAYTSFYDGRFQAKLREYWVPQKKKKKKK